jgi:hypothetical protein
MWIASRYIRKDEYQELIDGARALNNDTSRCPVLKLSDDRIVKLFPTQKSPGKAFFYPKNLRFARNVGKLFSKGITSVVVEDAFYCPGITRHGVIYRYLPGKKLVSILKGYVDDDLVKRLAEFAGKLASLGIQFKAPFLDNLLVLEAGDFALIDVAELHFYNRPLSRAMQIDNFVKLITPEAHRVLLRPYGWEIIVGNYAAAIGAGERRQKKLCGKLLAICEQTNQN